MSHAFWSLWVCLLLTTAAHARTNVYKCVDGPHPVYQQTPCQGRAEWALGGAAGAAFDRCDRGQASELGLKPSACGAAGACAGRSDTHQHRSRRL